LFLISQLETTPGKSGRGGSGIVKEAGWLMITYSVAALGLVYSVLDRGCAYL